MIDPDKGVPCVGGPLDGELIKGGDPNETVWYLPSKGRGFGVDIYDLDRVKGVLRFVESLPPTKPPLPRGGFF